jgi:23S rRNA pseudouridine1911/1915/1917 synthase
VKFTVVYEDNHVLVVNKPAGLATMGTAVNEPSLAREVQAFLKQKYGKPGKVYLGIVSRLDTVTSGLIVFAKTSKAAGRLTTQFQKRVVQKWYLAAVPSLSLPPALVIPDVPPLSWQQTWHHCWADRLWKDDAAHRMRLRKPGPSGSRSASESGASAGEASGLAGEAAALHWRYLAIGSHFDLVLVQLLTGRKHQIRVQFADRGYPILGDRKYGSPVAFPQGIALHAWRLAFQHPVSQETLTFCETVPAAWKILDPVQPWADVPTGNSQPLPVMPIEWIARLTHQLGRAAESR